jgi:prepilin-type N-terminal cleavage/methylation domain-containing protein
MMRFKRDGDAGFTLVETLVSITIFAMLMVGITPLLVSSIRGAGLTRSYTVGKNLTSKAMERVRGLPLFDSATKRDVIDFYFPNLGTGYNATTGTFTTICTATSKVPSPSADFSCPVAQQDGTASIPKGYTMTLVARFVQPAPSGSQEQFVTAIPTAPYSPDGEPFRPLMELSIETTWLYGGRQTRFGLSSVLGDRKLSPDKVRGLGAVAHVVRGLTSYRQDLTSPSSSITAIAGSSASLIQVKTFALASQTTTAAQATVARSEYGGVGGRIVSDQVGASSTISAPPNVSPAPLVTANPFEVSSDGLTPTLKIASVGSTAVNEASPLPRVVVDSQLPSAAGNFSFTDTGRQFWIDNQAQTGNTAALRLANGSRVLSVYETAGKRLRGNTSATTTASTDPTTRKVETTAHAEFARLELLPTNFTSGNAGVVIIENFVADVSCRANGLGGSTFTGSWSATLRYWVANTGPNPLAPTPGYKTVALSGAVGASGVDPLAAIKAENPLVYKGKLATDDIYLFSTPVRTGYLNSWSTQPSIAAASGTQTSDVTLTSAIDIGIAKTDLTNAETQLAVSLGSISCSAVDKR